MVRRDRLSFALCASAIAVAIFALGGASNWAQAGVAFLAAASLISVVTSKRRFARRPPLMILLFLAIGWTAIQCVPLPDAIISAMSPSLHSLRVEGANLIDVHVPATLTMDLGGTLRFLADLFALSAIAYSALRLSATEGGRYALLSCVAALAILAAFVSIIHKLVDAQSLYGIYTPHQRSSPILGPLLNPNHLGCLTALGAVISGSLVLYTKQRSVYRAGWVLGACMCLGVTTATLSRGALMAFAVGVSVMLATVFLQHLSRARVEVSRRERFLATTLPISVIVICALAVGIYFGGHSVVQQLEHTSIHEVDNPNSKFAAWRSAMSLVGEAPWVGVGRGAFEAVFTQVLPGNGYSVFSHPENEFVQIVVEWGWPAAILFCCVGIWLVSIALRQWRSGPLAAGALGALAAVGFQSNFDFGIELLGLAAPVVTIVATLSWVPLVESKTHATRIRWLRGVHLAAVVVSALVLFTSIAQPLEEEHLALFHDPRVPEIRAEIARHPMDYFGYALLAQQLTRAGVPDGVKVLNHALLLYPRNAALHRLTAQLLSRSKRVDQALWEYETALRYSRDHRPILTEMLSSIPVAADIARAIPVDLDINVTLQTLTDQHRPDVALLWLEQVVSFQPSTIATESLYSLALQQHDLAAAERAARLRCGTTSSTTCRLALARVLKRESKASELVTDLADVASWHGLRDEQLEAWLMLCEAQVSLEKMDDARACIRKLGASGIVSPEELEQRAESLGIDIKEAGRP